MFLLPWAVSHPVTPPALAISLVGAGMARLSATILPYSAALLALGGLALRVHAGRSHRQACHRQELSLRKELLAYLLFNGSPRTMPPIELGRQISRLIAGRSAFNRAAFLLRDESGVLRVLGSAGFDDLSVDALHRWAWTAPLKHGAAEILAAAGRPVANSSFTLQLDRRVAPRDPLSTMNSPSVHIVPLRTAAGLVGALVVCAEPRAAARLADPSGRARTHSMRTVLPLADLLQPLEALALRLTMQLTAPENLTPLWPAGKVTRRRSTTPRRVAIAAAVAAEHPSAFPGPSLPPLYTHSIGQPATAIPPAFPFRSALIPISGVSGRPPAHIWRRAPTPTIG